MTHSEIDQTAYFVWVRTYRGWRIANGNLRDEVAANAAYGEIKQREDVLEAKLVRRDCSVVG
jgi:hypothetical protein